MAFLKHALALILAISVMTALTWFFFDWWLNPL
jgi:hypothetical protein